MRINDETPFAYLTTGKAMELIESRMAALLASVRQDRWMKSEEASKYAGVSESTIERWGLSGEIEAANPGDNVVYRKSSIDAFYARNPRKKNKLRAA